jgi:hypothetical protein
MSDFMNGDMRGLNDLLYFAGLKSQQIEYILIQMIRTHNRAASNRSLWGITRIEGDLPQGGIQEDGVGGVLRRGQVVGSLVARPLRVRAWS